MQTLPARFLVNGRTVEPAANRVTAGGRAVAVEPKIMQVLVVLAEHAGEVVTRDALMARVWADVFVTDDVLHRAIRELRRLFGDDTGEPHVIETIRKRGYRLIAPIEAAGPRAAAPPGNLVGPRIPPAVLAGGPAAAILAAVAAGWLIAGVRVPTAAPVRFVPLTSAPGNEVSPALSPSGLLAYIARAADGRSHVFVKDPAEPQPRQITSGDAHEIAPAWAPDDRQIAFARVSEDSCDLWIADVLARTERRLAPCATTASMKMSWSPDGKRLAVAAGTGTAEAPLHLELIDIATGGTRAVTDPAAGGIGDDSPAFSPDGRSLAFVRSLSGSIGDVYVVSADGGAVRRVTTDDGDVMGVDWEADGRHLVFSSERGGGISLWRVPEFGGEPAFVAGGGAKLKHPSVARRTGAIAFENWHYEINLEDRGVALPEETRGVPIAPTSDRWNFHPQVAPDGSRIAFQSTRSGHYDIWVAARDGSNARQLTRSESYKSPPRWSPDGTRLVFSTRVAETAQLVVVNVDSGAAQSLAVGADAIVSPSWSHDGSRVYFGALRRGAWELSAVEMPDGPPRTIVANGYAAAESPDGRWLYYTRIDRRGLWRRRTGDDGEARLVSAAVQAEDWLNVAVTSDGVFYVAHPDAGEPRLTLIDPAGGETPLTRLPAFAWNGIALSADGRRVIYAHADRRDANIEELVR
ncbi:MAG TPA: winged helix-turn-helix domain-containing protein [Vicinamibacterales bacterium]|nr:winged helix-turn-helix domain-containing protein [Vicinamibacterales bacterium]